jgi:hypothetical protein
LQLWAKVRTIEAQPESGLVGDVQKSEQAAKNNVKKENKRQSTGEKHVGKTEDAICQSNC